MLPIQHLHLVDRPIKADSKTFIGKVMMNLLNKLKKRGIDARDVEVLGTNDISVFRGTKVVIVCLSRSRQFAQVVLSEMPLSELMSDESTIMADQPTYFDPAGLDKLLCTKHGFSSPVSVVFPLSYLSLKDAELEEAVEKVAGLLVSAAEEDVDKKRRIVRVNPIYSGREFLIDSDLCFVLMEFKSPYTEIYHTLIEPTVVGQGMKCLKSDDIFSTSSVIEDIWANINKAALIIAEISSNNPNVMYELGICHTVGKEPMMITQHPKDIPFNFRHLRCFPYTNDIPGYEDLKKTITSVVQHLKSTSKLKNA